MGLPQQVKPRRVISWQGIARSQDVQYDELFAVLLSFTCKLPHVMAAHAAHASCASKQARLALLHCRT